MLFLVGLLVTVDKNKLKVGTRLFNGTRRSKYNLSCWVHILSTKSTLNQHVYISKKIDQYVDPFHYVVLLKNNSHGKKKNQCKLI